MRAHLLQTAWPSEGKKAAFAQVRELLRGLAPAPGDLVVLPELFACGFGPGSRDAAEGDGKLEETAEFLSDAAREWRCTVQGTGIGLGKDGRLQNLVSVHGPDGRTIGTFEKIHPFRFGGEEVGQDTVLGLRAHPHVRIRLADPFLELLIRHVPPPPSSSFFNSARASANRLRMVEGGEPSMRAISSVCLPS